MGARQRDMVYTHRSCESAYLPKIDPWITQTTLSGRVAAVVIKVWGCQPEVQVEDGCTKLWNWTASPAGDTSDVCEVEMQRLNALSFNKAQAKYSEIAGLLAADKLRSTNQHYNWGLGVKIQIVEQALARGWLALRTAAITKHSVRRKHIQIYVTTEETSIVMDALPLAP